MHQRPDKTHPPPSRGTRRAAVVSNGIWLTGATIFAAKRSDEPTGAFTCRLQCNAFSRSAQHSQGVSCKRRSPHPPERRENWPKAACHGQGELKKRAQIRLGTLNVVTMTGGERESADVLNTHWTDVACVQERDESERRPRTMEDTKYTIMGTRREMPLVLSYAKASVIPLLRLHDSSIASCQWSPALVANGFESSVAMHSRWCERRISGRAWRPYENDRPRRISLAKWWSEWANAREQNWISANSRRTRFRDPQRRRREGAGFCRGIRQGCDQRLLQEVGYAFQHVCKGRA